MKSKRTKRNTNILDKNPNNWRGPFYYNTEDPRILVPKLNRRLGYTLNFGNLFSYLVLVGIIILIAMLSFLSTD